MPVPAPLKTVLVLGSAYAGNRSVEVLAKSLPLNWRIVVIDRSTHFCRESPSSYRCNLTSIGSDNIATISVVP
jgi:NADH dehydrogenase FAD-containing subunit